jgi:hypothetical protein
MIFYNIKKEGVAKPLLDIEIVNKSVTDLRLSY